METLMLFLDSKQEQMVATQQKDFVSQVMVELILVVEPQLLMN